MYINANFITLSHYLELLREQEHEVIELLSEDFEDDGRYPDIKNPVATTWVISFNSIRQRSQLAANYLSFMGCVDSKDIPLSMLPYKVSPKEMIDAIGTLQAFSFVAMRADHLAVTLHRLVHLATRNWLRKEEQLSNSIQRAMERLCILLNDPRNKDRIILRTYMPHAAYLLDSGALEPENAQYNVHPSPDTSSSPEERSIRDNMKEIPNELYLINDYAYCLNMEWRFQEAEVWYIRLADICKSKFGENHVVTLRSMRDLAWTLSRVARLAEAAEIAVDVLQKQRVRLGDQHPETLHCMHVLAGIYKEQGRWEEAEPLYGEVIVGLKTEFGPSHPDTLAAMDNLAGAYGTQGRWDLAAPLNEQALEGTKAALGEDHLDTLRSMSNLANTYNSQGRWEEAEALHLKALGGHKPHLGEGHPDTLHIMYSLANTYMSQGRWEEAEALHLKALEGRKAQPGESHPDTLASMNNLAHVWRALGRHSDAVDLLQSCLELRTQRLGKGHPDTNGTSWWLEKWRAEDNAVDCSKSLVTNVASRSNVSKSPRSSSRLGSASVVGTAMRTAAKRPRRRMVGSVLKTSVTRKRKSREISIG
jgi:tetratricopeptide (TPR) repeat protein